MEQTVSTHGPRPVRRPVSACLDSSRIRPAASTGGPHADRRWQLLDLVRGCRDRLKLRDRDIAVLRGLLSLLPADPGDHQRVVFASNRRLIDRCDGIDERTLRRRIAHLEARGLVTRRPSPNGKRYQMRDETGAAVLSYGVDLSPLFAIHPHLEALAEECRREAMRVRALKARLRDLLFHHPHAEDTALREEARLSLRRSITAEHLAALIATLQATLTATETPQTSLPDARQVSATNGQTDRHIQSQKKEISDSERAGEGQTGCAGGDCATERTRLEKWPTEGQGAARADAAHQGGGRPEGQGRREDGRQDMTVAECVELAATARQMAPLPPRDWGDIVQLSRTLGPAIGLAGADMAAAERRLGHLGAALAVLGLVEAFGRIRDPGAYLASLARKAGEIDPVRMFRSLVRAPRGQRAPA